MSTWINDKTGQSGSFEMPSTKVGPDSVKAQFPFVDKQSLTIASNKASATIAATETILEIGSEALAADTTLTVDPKTPVGAKSYVKFICGGTKHDVVVKIGTTTEATITGVASKTNLATFLWDGSHLLTI